MPWGNSEDWCATLFFITYSPTDDRSLYLNVYTPYLPSSSPTRVAPTLKPVLFWIHGGGNTQGEPFCVVESSAWCVMLNNQGTGSDATFDGGSLVSRTDVVVVTINHRLNIFGFLALNDGVVTGNYDLADKIAALEWVRDNIAAFGGDAARVTIAGQSAGGSSVLSLVTSPKAKDLFYAAISQSGGSSPIQSMDTAEAAVCTCLFQGSCDAELNRLSTTVPYISEFCNNTGIERLECLQALPADTLLNITNYATSWLKVQDGIYATNSSVNLASQGPDALNSIHFMAGFMPEEGQS